MNIFCSGIGGIGLSAYASLQKARGHTVSGSDRCDSALLQDLRQQGIGISLRQDGSALPDHCDLLVYSEAIPADAPERRMAANRNIATQSYFQALGELSRGYFVIAVCGTHGKSSTTAMTARMLMDTGHDPTVVIGTKMRELSGRNWRRGRSNLFVVEACEYRRSFHYLSPDIVLMLNVDGDHFDAYPTVEAYREAYVTFLRLLPASGSVILHGGDTDALAVGHASGRTIKDADVYPLVTLTVPGLHMRQNAQLVLALADIMGIDNADVRQSLAGFSGTWRRMEERGTTMHGAMVIDDYAHHPLEIRATLAAIKHAYSGRRIIVVFQPHTHDRTLRFYDEFTRAFADADLVIVPNVYDARREIETTEVDVPRFVSDIAKQSNVEAYARHGLNDVSGLLHSILQPNDVLITMGAGDVTQLAGTMLKQ